MKPTALGSGLRTSLPDLPPAAGLVRRLEPSTAALLAERIHAEVKARPVETFLALLQAEEARGER